MKRSQLPPNKSATYVLPQWKTVYVSVPKAACTSLKWLVADLQGEPPEHFYDAISRETGRSMTIHHRARWQHTPMLRDLTDEQLEEVRPDNDWFIFAVVRHPSARLWSGWQSKFLLKEPRFRAMFPDAPWPRIPEKTADVVEDFAEFVRFLDGHRDEPVFHDRHFRSQTRLLKVAATPYSRIYKTSEMGQLLGDLQAHLRPLGLETLPRLRKSNETPLRPVSALFDDETTKVIERQYASDFERFGYDDVVPTGLEPEAEYPSEVLAEVGRLVERAERIGDLYDAAVRAKEAKREASAEVARLRKQLRRASQPKPSAPRRALGRLKRQGLAMVRSARRS